MMDRLLAGELHRRLVISIVGVFIFVGLFAVLGGSFFL
jgi:hypothetical protein